MAALQEQLHLDLRRFRFVDVGSGKGRALLLASEYPFIEVMGIELSPELDLVARANIARYVPTSRHRTPVSCTQGDAADWGWPPGPLIVYMWNAFTGPVMELVFQNLAASLAQEPRELYLLYIHPELEPMLAELPWLIQVLRDEFPMSEEDYAAWAFPSRAEMCSVYRLLPPPP
jgi:SAM-dependent methyltransferase